MSPEMTRGSITGQVKALSMIVAIEGLIPDRRAVSAEKEPAPPPTGQIYTAAWLRRQRGETVDPEPGPALAQEEDDPGLAEPAPGWAADPPPPPGPTPGPTFHPSQSVFANRFTPSEATPSAPYAPLFVSAPDTYSRLLYKKEPLCPATLSC